MTTSAAEIIRNPSVGYEQITPDLIEQLNPEEAERTLVGILAERALIKDGGRIVLFPEFNEAPDILITDLMSKVLFAQIPETVLEGLQHQNFVVLSVETSGVHLASSVTRYLTGQFRLKRYPSILRARKTYELEAPSPAMGNSVESTTVYPITSGGKPRYLTVSTSDMRALKQVSRLIVVDDFLGTGNSLKGATEIGIRLLEKAGVDMDNLQVIPMIGIRKRHQVTNTPLVHPGVVIFNPIAALDVEPRLHETTGEPVLYANGFPPYLIRNAYASDFDQKQTM